MPVLMTPMKTKALNKLELLFFYFQPGLIIKLVQLDFFKISEKST